MKTVSRARLGVSLLAVIQIATAGAALAQVAPPATPDEGTQAAVSEDGIEEIVVSAQLRDQRLQDVPISLSVVGGDLIDELGATSLTDVATRIPNVNFQRVPGGQALLMRGMGSGTGARELEQSIAIFVDGIYGGLGRQFNSPFLDIERLEILRGPQGALVGKNTVAGAINIITKRPEDEFGGFVNANYDFGLRGPTVEGGVNVPLAPGLAIRVVGQYSDQDGHLYNTLLDQREPQKREVIGRVSLGYEAGPFDAFLKLERNDVDIVGNMLQIFSPSRDRPLAWRKATRAPDGPEIDDLKTDNAVLQLDYDFDWARLTSISGYSSMDSIQHFDGDFTELEAGLSNVNLFLDQYSQEFRLVSDAGKSFDYVVGALFQTNELFSQQSTGTLRAPAASTYRTFDQETDEFSAFAQAGYEFGAFRLQGSLRYTHVRRTATYQRFTGPGALQLGGDLVATIDGELTNNLWDPAVTLQYKPTDDLMFYASYQHGSKAGGFQGAIVNATESAFVFSPETSKSYEVGARFDLRRRGYLNLTAFYTNYDDQQISAGVRSPDGLTAPFFTANAARARTIGLELESLLRLTPEFELAAAGAWNPIARFEEFPAGPCAPGQVRDGSEPGTCNNEGVRLNRAPRLVATVTPTYKRDIASNLRFTASATAIYQGRQRKFFQDDPLSYQDGHFKFDARLAIGASDQSWELGVTGRNITNKLTFNNNGTGGIGPRLFAPDARNVILDLPRQIIVTGSLKF